MVDRRVHLEQVGASDQVLEPPDPECGHQPADLFSHEDQVVDHVLGAAPEARPQLRVLSRDSDRARVQVADPHHDAAHRDQRRGREAELVGAEQRTDHDIAAGLHLAVDLDRDARAQIVQQ